MTNVSFPEPAKIRKVCARCKERRQAICFFRSPQTKDGLTSWCKFCSAAVRKQRRRGEILPSVRSKGGIGYFRYCRRCDLHKPATAFGYHRSQGRQGWCKVCAAQEKRAHYVRHKGTILAREKAIRWEMKLAMIAAYGGCCACCGEDMPEFLTIDHLAGGGTKHRLSIGNNLIKWLKKKGWPREGFQLLCYNCNCSKGSYGECPHERARRARTT